MTTEEKQVPDGFHEWVILEVMGHKRLAGLMKEEEIAGQPFLRIDVPGDGDQWAGTQFYSPSSVYCITPTTEEMARRLAARWWQNEQPVSRFELPEANTDTAPLPEDDWETRSEAGYDDDDHQEHKEILDQMP